MNRNSNHPPATQLEAYGLGFLSEAEAAPIEVHLETCDTCCLALGTLPEDGFVSLLCSAHAAGTVERTDWENARTVHPLGEPSSEVSKDPTLFPQKPPGDDTVDPEGMAPADPGEQIPTELTEHPRYRVVKLLGRSGMGTVYEAEHRLMQRRVALKVINRRLVDNPRAADRFVREVKAAARLVHPNIVTAFDAEQAGELHFLVMEFVPGEDLHKRVSEGGRLPVAEACNYVRQAALGLEHARSQGMVHRDIKPQNLMLTPTGQVKILDFGLARLASEAGGDTSLTTENVMMGTPDYMAPEQSEDARTADIRADIYGLGCTLYFLLSGRTPFPEGTAMQKALAHREREPAPIQKLRPDVPAELAAVLKRMMARDPAKRFQTPAEAAEALAPFAVTQKTLEKPRRWRPVLLGVAALAAALLLAATVIFVQTRHGTVRIDVGDDPAIKVHLAGEVITVENAGKPITIRPGEHTLVVERDGLKFTTPKFTLGRGANPDLKVEFTRERVLLAKLGDRLLDEKGETTPAEITQILRNAALVLTFEKDTFYEKDDKTWVRDLSGQGNDARCELATFTASGQAGGAIGIHGKGRLHVPRRLIASGKPFTVAGWVRRNLDWAQGDPLVFAQFSKDRKKELSCGLGVVDGQFCLNFVSSTAYVGSVFSEDRNSDQNRNFARQRWGFVAWSRDETGQLRFTVDGRTEERDHRDLGEKEEDSHIEVEIGRFLDGYLDEMVVLNRALSDADLQRLYEWGKGGRPLPANVAPAGNWMQLFNGKDLTGWKTIGPITWKVEDGVLVTRVPADVPQGGRLTTVRDDYQNFHARLEAKISDGSDSGFYFRASEANPGYQVQLGNKGGSKTGSLLRAGAVQVALDSPVRPDTWFTLEVIARDSHIVIKVDGKTVIDRLDPEPCLQPGKLGLETGFASTIAHFRKIEVRELPPSPTSVPNILRDASLVMNFEKDTFYEKDGKTWVRDLSGQGNDGLCEPSTANTSGTTYTPNGLAGGALACNGKNLKLPEAFVRNQKEYTLAGWVWDAGKGIKGEVNRVLFQERFEEKSGSGHLFHVTLEGTRVWASCWRNGPWAQGSSPINTVPKEQWFFLALRLTQDDNRSMLHITINDQTYRTPFSTLQTDKMVFDVVGGIAGKIDELAIFQRALSDVEIQALYKWGKQGRQLPEPLWPRDGITLVRRLEGHQGSIRGIQFFPDGKRLASITRFDQKLRVWKFSEGVVDFDIATDEPLYALALSGDGRRAALGKGTTAGSSSIEVWDLKERKQLWTAEGHASLIKDVDFAADGRRILSAGGDGKVILWDAANGKVLRTTQHEQQVFVAKFSPEGKHIFIGNTSGELLLLEAETGKVVYQQVIPGRRSILTAAFSRDGSRILAGTTAGSVYLLDAATGKVIRELQSTTSYGTVAFLPNERFAVTGAGDRLVQIWDLESGQEVTRLKTANHVTRYLAVSPDGRYVVGGAGYRYDRELNKEVPDSDSSLHIWRLPETVWPKTGK